MLAAMAVTCPCFRWGLGASQHAIGHQPAYLKWGKQVGDLAKVDLCRRTVIEYGERKEALVVMVSHRRHISRFFCRYGTVRQVMRAAQVIDAAAFGVAQGMVGEQELSRLLFRIPAFVDVRVVLQRKVFECFFYDFGRSICIHTEDSIVISKLFHC